jgi:ribokinase
LRPKLGVVGSINIDLVARVTRLPRPGETVGATAFERVPGGKGANQAVAAARLGADVTFRGAVGDDPFADEAKAGMVEAGVNGIFEVTGSTGVAMILVDDEGENQITVVAGANGEASPGGLFGSVLCQLEIPLENVVAAAEAARWFCLNAAPATPVPASLIEQCDLVVVNRYELEALPVQPRLTALTLGAEGAVLYTRERELARAQPPKVTAVDGTAAGDAFTACLVVSMLEHRPSDEALQRACAAGAIAASRPGAQPSLPTAAEVDAILAA